MMLPPRPICPADDTTTLFDLVGSKFGAGELPGTRNASSRKLRPLSGRASMALDGITASTTERVVSTPVVVAATSTRSRTPATARLTSMVTAWPTSSTMLPWVASPNPLAVTVRLTTMGGRFATTKDPSSPVGTTRDSAVPGPMTVTVADGTGRPCESRTSPRIVAVAACPYANDA